MIISLTVNNEELASLYHVVKYGKRDQTDYIREWADRCMNNMSDAYRSRDMHIVVFKDDEMLAFKTVVRAFINRVESQGRNRDRDDSERFDMAVSIYRMIRDLERKEQKQLEVAAENGWDTGQEVWDTGQRPADDDFDRRHAPAPF